MKLAVICATPAGTNNGMVSVDLAFDSIKKLLPAHYNFVRLCGWKSIKKNKNFEYDELVEISQLEDADKIIFWGDFLHWIDYANRDWMRSHINNYPMLTPEEIIDKWYHLYLLENREDLQKKVIIFGNTLYGLNSDHLLNSRYVNALTQLYSNASSVLFRDVLSSNYLSQLTGNRQRTFFGCDCALMLDQLPAEEPINDYFLYSFGRSGSPEMLDQLVKDISKELNLTPLHLEWLKKGAGLETLEENLKLMKGSKFVLTDIYHCAINAYRENVKVVCVGNAACRVTDTLSDKKKELFHFQHFASKSYFYLEQLTSQYDSELIRILNLINDDSYYENIFKLLSIHVEQVKNELIHSIKK